MNTNTNIYKREYVPNLGLKATTSIHIGSLVDEIGSL
jgi:hypothetical protein